MLFIKIIAECGCNWDSIEQAKEMIRRSKEVGCFLSKFQLFTKKEAPNLPEHLYLTFEQAKDLFNYGKSIKQEVFFTPMYLEAVDFLENELNVKYYKIRNKDLYNFELIKKAYSTTKPIFISLEYHTFHSYSSRADLIVCIKLGVVPKYPAKFEDYSFSFRHGYMWACEGLSDHTPDTNLLESCLWHGKYEYFEKHLKLEGTKPLEDKWSISFRELEEVLKKNER